MTTAIILAGGTGTRIGASVPKQFIEIQGKPILAYTLEVFESSPSIDAIEIVSHRDWVEEVKGIAARYGITKTRWVTEGGDTFQESVMKGLFRLKGEIAPEDLVVISFGVSPMTTHEIIDDGIRVAALHGNAISSDPMTLCTCIKDDEESSTTSILRETLMGFANPWTFRFGEVVEAYETAMERGILGELEPHTTSLYFALGKRIWFSKSATTNIKITTPEDLDIFEGLLLLRQKRAMEEETQEGTL